MADTRYGRAAGPGRGEGVRRDAALHRVGKLTKRIAVATVAAVGILGLYVSKSLPGHATTPAGQSPAGTTTPTTSAPAAAPGSGPSTAPTTAPAAPASPPVTTRKPAHVTTGAS
ncbi:MAG TPA: hypothetical protein VG014_07080 [Acidimicrobiales bacterium]|jgi:hypothetical protein|nr:hypothetical protein [Acidimicrobiales bacterium]